MKVKVIPPKDPDVTLTMSSIEARWLLEYMQNSCVSPELELEEDRKMRKMFFDTLHNVRLFRYDRKSNS